MKKQPPKPYYAIAHDYADSFEAFRHSSSMLFASVKNVLTILDELKVDKAKIVFDHLKEAADKYRAAVYGDD